MLKFIEKISVALLFFLGLLWGNLWITRILSSPEWWFIAGNALLCGAGIYLIRFLPEAWQKTAPALIAMPVLLFTDSTLSDLLFPLLFGTWYGGNNHIYRNWRDSRTFCGGLLIGGIIAGLFSINHLFLQYLPENFARTAIGYSLNNGMIFTRELVPLLTGLLLLYSGCQNFPFFALDSILLITVYGMMFIPPPAPEPIPTPEQGTVISAFSLLEDMEKVPRTAFIGLTPRSAFHTLKELDPVANVILLPELPGTLPEKCDMIFISRFPRRGDGGQAALLRTLRPDGILICPTTEIPADFPAKKWLLLPGSNAQYAATSPTRQLEIDPDKMDDRLAKFYRKRPDIAPLPGVLAGLLTGFESRQIQTAAPTAGKNIIFQLSAAMAALFVLIAAAVKNARQQKNETGRLLINCVGYTMLVMLTVPHILSGMPPVGGLRTLTATVALLWIFRRPYRRKRDYLCFAGILALGALAASWFKNWICSAAALVFGGYTFAALDGELISADRDNDSESIRFLGFAIGMMLTGAITFFPHPEIILFIAAALLRFWSWFRN